MLHAAITSKSDEGEVEKVSEVDDALATETTSLVEGNKTGKVQKNNKKWLLNTASLAFTLLTQSYLLVSVFPYSGFMAMHLIPSLNEETAGSYAGLIASSFMIGRTFSSFEWGRAADKYGRTFVIKASLLLSAVLSILFGLAPTFYSALFLRFILGMCNGLIGPIKTYVSEIADGDEALETRTLALILGMWGYGFLLNPAISGYLSDPVKQYPNSKVVETFAGTLRSFPFLLPNLTGFLFCLIAYVLVDNFVDETLPPEKCQDFQWNSLFPCCLQNHLLRSVSSWGMFKHAHFTKAQMLKDDTIDNNQESETPLPKWIRPSPSSTALIIAHSQSKESEENLSEQRTEATISSLWNRTSTRQHCLVYWSYSFLIISVDESFPLFCISKDSGLAIHERLIGRIFSGSGFLYITMQYFLITNLVGRFGLYKALRIATFFSIPLCCLIPLSLLTNQHTAEGELTLSTFVFLSIVYGTMRVFSSVVFSSLTMATNKTVPAHHRATMNGFSMLGGSLAKALGPAFAGVLFSSCNKHITPPYGSVVVYSIIASLGLGLCVQALLLQEHKQDKEESVTLVKDEEVIVIDEDNEDLPTF